MASALSIAAWAMLATGACAAQLTGGISGVVLNYVTGEPVPYATVRVSTKPESTLHANGAGEFIVEKLPSGFYAVNVGASGFLSSSRYQPTAPVQGVGVSAGQTENVRFRLIPESTITGRVLDAQGKPRSGVTVRAMPVERRLRDGGLRALGYSTRTVTNEQGEYRLEGLPQARYWVLAEVPRGLSRRELLAGRQWPVIPHFHSTSNPTAPTTLRLRRGASLTGVDIRVGDAKGVRVAGVVRSPRLGGNFVSVSLISREPPDYWGEYSLSARVGEDGVFEFTGVPPGDYGLTASIVERNASAAAPRDVVHIPLRVDLVDRGGLALEPVPSFTMTADVEVDGGSVDWRYLGVDMARIDQDRVGPRLKPTGTGSLVAEEVSRGEYHLSHRGGYNSCYIQSAFLEGRDVMNNAVFLTGPSRFQIRMPCDGGTVSGQMETLRHRDSVVVLWPVDKKNRNLLHTARSDGGSYRVLGIVPGKYRMAAFLSVPSDGSFDFDWLKDFEDRAVTIEVGANEKLTLPLKPIDTQE